ncbi:hypothetical protein scyTo_0017892 [Scyliorhinus torazame]|uniref:RNase H type-1 domain-containing protein n=1 Tax=Scyliorhinus torazame TaxID=75743 RepID=A0A401Q269_SCYTO|nr:hypothetical protein [Scyliorhinus torazame]
MGSSEYYRHGTKGSQIPGTWSAQVAELIGLGEALRLAAGKRVNIYIDSRYAFGVIHDYMVAWARRGYITSSGGHVQHEQHIRDLVEAASAPAEATVIKVAAHKKIQTPQQQGDDYADSAVMALTEQIPEGPGEVVSAIAAPEPDPDTMGRLQATAREEEKEEWKREGTKHDPDEIWRKEGRPVAPRAGKDEKQYNMLLFFLGEDGFMTI